MFTHVVFVRPSAGGGQDALGRRSLLVVSRADFGYPAAAIVLAGKVWENITGSVHMCGLRKASDGGR